MSPETIIILLALGAFAAVSWILWERVSNVGDLSLWDRHFGRWTAERKVKRLVEQVRREAGKRD